MPNKAGRRTAVAPFSDRYHACHLHDGSLLRRRSEPIYILVEAGDIRAVTLLTSPHLSQVFLIDSRALARLKYAQMFPTEPFIIAVVWFNLYSGVPRLCQHLEEGKHKN